MIKMHFKQLLGVLLFYLHKGALYEKCLRCQ